jgi:hypothetical protein
MSKTNHSRPEEIAQRGTSKFALSTKYYHQIKEDEIGRACGMHGRDNRSIQNLRLNGVDISKIYG